MKPKTYTIRFFAVNFGGDGKAGSVHDLLGKHADQKTLLSAEAMGTSAFQVRQLKREGSGQISGSFVRFRDESPLVGTRTSEDERVALDDHEETLEKNHFVVFKDANDVEIVGFQMSLEGGHPTSLAAYLTRIAGEQSTISLADIPTADAMEQLMNGVVKGVAFRIAKPKKKSYQPNPEDTWTNRSIQFMESTGASTFAGSVSIRSPKKGLLNDVKQQLRFLLESPQTRSLKVKLSEVNEPIDLFMERVHEKINVTLIKGRPESTAVISGILVAKQKVQPHLDHYFGD